MPHKTSYRKRSQSFKGARLVARVSQSLRNLACLSKALMARRLPNFKVIREFLHRILRLRVFMRSWNKTSSRYIESVPWCSSYTLCCSCVFAEAIKKHEPIRPSAHGKLFSAQLLTAHRDKSLQNEGIFGISWIKNWARLFPLNLGKIKKMGPVATVQCPKIQRNLSNFQCKLGLGVS